jgi:hypothetical protein
MKNAIESKSSSEEEIRRFRQKWAREMGKERQEV